MSDDAGRKFRLGRVHLTSEASDALDLGDVRDALEGHACGHWGQVDAYTRHDNDQALEYGGLVFSVHADRAGNLIEIRTDAARTLTTVDLSRCWED